MKSVGMSRPGMSAEGVSELPKTEKRLGNIPAQALSVEFGRFASKPYHRVISRKRPVLTLLWRSSEVGEAPISLNMSIPARILCVTLSETGKATPKAGVSRAAWIVEDSIKVSPPASNSRLSKHYSNPRSNTNSGFGWATEIKAAMAKRLRDKVARRISV